MIVLWWAQVRVLEVPCACAELKQAKARHVRGQAVLQRARRGLVAAEHRQSSVPASGTGYMLSQQVQKVAGVTVVLT